MRLAMLTTGTIGAVIGAAMWSVSAAAVSEYEPYDHSLTYYACVLGATGFIVGLVIGRPFWIALIGLYLGQVAVMVLHPNPNNISTPPLLYLIAAGMVLLFTLIAFAAGLFGYFGRRIVARMILQRRGTSAAYRRTT